MARMLLAMIAVSALGTVARAQAFCFPGVSSVQTCPCSNPQVPAGSSKGCDNSSGTGGADLTGTGVAVNGPTDTLALTTTGARPNSTCVLLQGNGHVQLAGVIYGDGVRCFGGMIKRLFRRVTDSTGAVSFGHGIGTDLDIHAQSCALGDCIVTGTWRAYAVAYRDPASFACSPAFNVSSAYYVAW